MVLHRIELGEIETAVSSLPEISLNCCLYDEKRQKIVLFIEEDLEKAYTFLSSREEKGTPLSSQICLVTLRA